MEDAQAIDAYLHNLDLRGLAITTKRNRRSQLEILSSYLGETRLLDATREQLTEWTSDLLKSRTTARTRYAKISNVHGFYVWAHDEELVEDDPSHKLPRPKLPKSLPRPIPEDSLERAMVGAPQDIRAWLTLAAYAGLRCCEIAPMTRDQILDTIDPPMLLVHGKGDKDRLVPLNRRVIEELHRCDMPNRGHLWTERSRTGQPPTANRVSQLLNRWLHEAGIPDTAHSLRHRFATLTHGHSGDLLTTAALLGHASVSTTQVYAAFNNAKGVAAVLSLDVPYPSEPSTAA